MYSITEIKKLFDKYEVGPSKRFGQNFLIDLNILNKIVKVFDIKDQDVIEVGPGLGSLTHMILKEAKSLTSYEIDEDMIRVIKSEINNEKFTLVEGDFLRANLEWEGKKICVANIPYNITSDILFKLFENKDKVSKAVLMVQKEVAQRLTANIGAKDYSKLTVTANYFADVKYEFTVPANAFLPAPKVDSAIISLDFKDVETDHDFVKFIKRCFAMRRKTLYNNLKQFVDADKAKEAILSISDNESIRPQELSLNNYIKLFNGVK